MRVLLNTHPAAFQAKIFGGAEIQLLKTLEYLKKLGVKAKIFDMADDKLEGFDILHNFAMHRDTFTLFNAAKDAGIKLALSSIYWSPTDLFRSDEKLKALGKIVFDRLGLFKLEFNPFYKLYPYQGFLDLADVIMPNSHMEVELIRKRFKVNAKKFFVVPNGVDKKYYAAKPDLFLRKYHLKDFILFVGRIEPRKNLIKAIKVAKEIDKPLVIIGNAHYYTQDYYDRCKKEAKDGKIYFLGSFPKESEMLASAYAAAKVFILPSWFETPGLAALEAGLAGCNMAISDRGSTKEYFGNFVDYCNPADLKSIKEAVAAAFDREKNNILKEHILKNYAWKSVAEKTLEAYRGIKNV